MIGERRYSQEGGEPPHPYRRAITIAALLAAALLLVGCDTNSTDDQKRALEQRAAERPKQATVSIGAIHHPPSGDDAEHPAPFRTDREDGSALEVREAYLVIAAVELHACEPGRDDYESPGGPLLNSIGDLLVPPARTHVASSSNRYGTPFVDDLAADPGSADILGELSPPLAAYCRVAAVVAPADPDVVNATPLSTESIVGSSIVVRGRQRASAEDEWSDFEWTSDAARVFEFEALDPNTGESPLVLDSPDDQVMLLIDKTVGAETFDVDPEDDDPAATVIENVGSSLRVHTY